jgi:hypothetical protein
MYLPGSPVKRSDDLQLPASFVSAVRTSREARSKGATSLDAKPALRVPVFRKVPALSAVADKSFNFKYLPDLRALAASAHAQVLPS